VLSPYRLVTNVLNATISFSYTGKIWEPFVKLGVTHSTTWYIQGPSFMVRTIPSRAGGAFSLFIDGFDTSNIIDTYNANASTPEEARGERMNPNCYHIRQFPPMMIVPIGYEDREAHTVTLVYIGAGQRLLGTDPSNLSVQFDSFALPIYSEAQMSSAPSGRESGIWTVETMALAMASVVATGSLFLS
jgi:YD repeat-containing protein